MLRAARTASSIARTGKGTVPVGMQALKLPDHYPVERFWDDVDLSVRVPLVREWEARAFARDPRIRKVQVTLADTDSRVLIARADGTLAADYRPMTRAFVSCTAEEGGLRESGSYNLASRSDLSFYTLERQHRLVDTAVDRAILALHAGSPPAGEMP